METETIELKASIETNYSELGRVAELCAGRGKFLLRSKYGEGKLKCMILNKEKKCAYHYYDPDGVSSCSCNYMEDSHNQIPDNLEAEPIPYNTNGNRNSK